MKELNEINKYDKDELLTFWLASKIKNLIKVETTAVASLKMILNELTK